MAKPGSKLRAALRHGQSLASTAHGYPLVYTLPDSSSKGRSQAEPPFEAETPVDAAVASGEARGGEDHAIGRSRGGLSTKINAVVDNSW